jgi:hypothetical protein
VHALVDESRRPWRRRERSAGYALPELPGPDHADQVDERLRIRAALARMAPGQRAVLVLRYYEGLSVEETAEVLGRQPGTVKSQTARGLAALRALLGSEDLRVTDDVKSGAAASGVGITIGLDQDGREGYGSGSAHAADVGSGRRAATAAQR